MNAALRARPSEPEGFDPEAALRVLRKRTTIAPRTGLVLGSGLGVIADGVAWDAAFRTEDIPGLPRPTIPGHAGRLLIGRWAGRPVVVAQGRSHLYEGHTAEEVTRMVRLFAALGVKSLVLTNAAGGIAPRMAPGTLMLVEDQINLQWRAPGRPARPGAAGSIAARGGEARDTAPSASNPRGLTSRPTYSDDFMARATRAAVVAGVRLERGVLGVMLGPCYETPAEITMLERLGADAVCMSTAAESAAAAALGIPAVGISCVTNWAAGRSPKRLAHGDVTAAVSTVAAPLKSIVERLILALA